MNDSHRKTIAVIGAGISGLGIASLLHPHHDIVVYEKNPYIGGHSRTIDVMTKDGAIPVDTGFIVFNERNYPLLTRLFAHLQVPIQASNMSFGASIDAGRLEYATHSLSGLFAQKANLIQPAFWRMLIDIVRFNAQARRYLTEDPAFTLGACLDALKLGPWFRDYFLLAMGGAIWSTPLQSMLQFPASTFIRFFDNHGLLTINDQPQWYTVRGGSRAYVQRLTAPFITRIHCNRALRKVWRTEGQAVVEDIHGQQARYDAVVFACHADQALKLMADADSDERNLLSAFRYQSNRIILHRDTSFMPRRRQAWASWVYRAEALGGQPPILSLSYWMNNLQPLATQEPIFVTLNPGHVPNPGLVDDAYVFEHPIFDTAAIRSQSMMETIQGRNRFWFCGAHLRYGFHEDGLGSAVHVAKHMGIEPPW